jgi:hypothetical protein
MTTEVMDALAQEEINENELFLFETTKTPNAMYFIYQEDPKLQLPYTWEAVNSGMYRRWIQSLTEAQLLFFQEINEKKINQALEQKLLPPDFSKVRHLLTRNFLYEVELHRRRFGWDQSAREKVYGDCMNELRMWEERFAMASASWYGAVECDSESEVELPY